MLFLLDYFLIFSATFISDKTFLGITLFLPIWFVIIIRRKKIHKAELISQLVLLIFSPLFLRGGFISSDIEYYNFYFQMLGYVNVIGFFYEFIARYSKKKILIASLAGLIIFSIGTLAFVMFTGSRGRFIFGPNVTYRVIAYFYGFCLLYFYSGTTKKFNLTKLFSIVSVVFVVGMLSTGSRGALIVLLLYVLCIFLYTYRNPKVFLIFSSFVVGIIAVVVYYWEIFQFYFSRVIYFNLSNNSEAYRYSKWIELIDFSSMDEFYFGLTEMNSFMPFYPHNIFLEVTYYFGLFASLFFVLIFFCYVFRFKNITHINLLLLACIFGSLVSGNLQYNYMVISIFTYCLSLVLTNKRLDSNYE